MLIVEEELAPKLDGLPADLLAALQVFVLGRNGLGRDEGRFRSFADLERPAEPAQARPTGGAIRP